MHCQTRKGRQGEKLSQVESVYLILPQSTQEEVDKLSKAIESSATAL
jgi:hypothetical protein